MGEPSPVLEALARRFRSTKAGRTGEGIRDLSIDYEDLLEEAQAVDGDNRIIAERQLLEAEKADILTIIRHPKNPGFKSKVIFPCGNEAILFRRLNQSSPAEERAALSELFRNSVEVDVPPEYREGWNRFCLQMSEAAGTGGTIAPLQRWDNHAEILQLLQALLQWRGETLIRFASSILSRDSKRLEQLRSKLETCLSRITNAKIQSLADIGIFSNERSILFHGPVELHFPEGVLNLELLSAPVRVDHRDVQRAQIVTSATTCVTVENAAMLHELSKRKSGIIYASSGSEGGFAHPAIVDFLNRLPSPVRLIHFGDSDPKGFEILHNLRVRLNRPIQSAGMYFRNDIPPVELSRDERKNIHALLRAEDLTEAEKAELQAMLDAGSKGRFEQEAMRPEEMPQL